MFKAQVYAFADDARVPRDRGAYEVGVEYQRRVLVEVSRQAFLRQFYAVALDPRKPNFQGIPIGVYSLDLYRLARRMWRGPSGAAVRSGFRAVGATHLSSRATPCPSAPGSRDRRCWNSSIPLSSLNRATK